MSEIEKKIVLSSDVQLAIDQVLQSTDPFDRPSFNATDYINQMFPNEQSLANIDNHVQQLEISVSLIDDNIRTCVRSQVNTGQEGQKALDDAKRVIQNLFGQITDIKHRAENTEDMVREITRDIKQLDSAKKNLTSAITTLNHLHMLLGGVESLTKLAEKRLYGELLNPLQAIIEVNQHFQQFTEISHIKTLSNKVAQIQSELSTQINTDFRNAFGSNPNSTKMSISQLTDACKVVSVLDPKVKRDLLKWFIALQLQEYQQLFHENQDISWLDKIDKRYAWLKRHLLEFEEKLGVIFPQDWEISERITVQFCSMTSDELGKLMTKRRHEMHVKLLLFAINKTQQFEQLLGKRFSGVTLQESKGSPTNAAGKQIGVDSSESSKQQDPTLVVITTPFTDLICNCFKPFLDIYTDSIDKNLMELMEQFQQAKFNPQEQIAKKSSILTSGADLFVFYKKCLVQCNQLSNGKPMYDLAMVFKKYLREYANKCLENKIPKLNTATATATNLATNISSGILNRENFQQFSTAAGQVLQNFLKEGDVARYSDDDRIQICYILTTSEYCLETVQQLEDKLKEKIDTAFAEFDLGEEKDVFHRVISSCIQILVHDLESGCDYGLGVMAKVQWQNISNVGDQSEFVNFIVKEFRHFIPIVRDNLASSRKYYTQFCLKFISSFIPRYINNLFKCRPTLSLSQTSSTAPTANSSGSNTGAYGESNVLGCEQLLLDTHSLKTVLLDLPSINSQVNRKAPASYTKVVISGMTKAEMIIKIVMAPIHPHQSFTEQYLKLLPESSMQEFQKVLDMKSIKRMDQTQILEVFRRCAPQEMLNQTHDPYEKQEGSEGRIKKLENLLKKRIPN